MMEIQMYDDYYEITESNRKVLINELINYPTKDEFRIGVFLEIASNYLEGCFYLDSVKLPGEGLKCNGKKQENKRRNKECDSSN